MSAGIFRIGGNGLEKIADYQELPVGTIINKNIPTRGRVQMVITARRSRSVDAGGGQIAVSLDGKLTSEVSAFNEKGGTSIGSYDVTENCTSEEEAARLLAINDEIQNEHYRKVKQKEETEKAARTKGEAIWNEKAPKDAVAVIVAILQEDASDIMTDYFASKDVDKVILAFSFHAKNDFNEMRKAARKFEPTKFLANKVAEYEHRQNYTGGSGYFLGEKYSRSGWIIKKVPLGIYSLPGYYELAGTDESKILPFVQPEATEASQSPEPIGNLIVRKNEEKKGIEIKKKRKKEGKEKRS